MSSRDISLIGYDGNTKTVNKVAFYAELDQEGNVFYKSEAQTVSETAALSIIYDKEEAFAEFSSLLFRVLESQSKRLTSDQ